MILSLVCAQRLENFQTVSIATRAQSPELKAAMEKAGVDGAPSVSFLNEI
jgi:hypothetical protein